MRATPPEYTPLQIVLHAAADSRKHESNRAAIRVFNGKSDRGTTHAVRNNREEAYRIAAFSKDTDQHPAFMAWLRAARIQVEGVSDHRIANYAISFLDGDSADLAHDLFVREAGGNDHIDHEETESEMEFSV